AQTRCQLRGGCPVFLATGFHRATNFCLAVVARRSTAARPGTLSAAGRGLPRQLCWFRCAHRSRTWSTCSDAVSASVSVARRRSPFASLSTWRFRVRASWFWRAWATCSNPLIACGSVLHFPARPIAPARTLRVAALSSRSLFRTAACCLASVWIAFFCATCVLDGDADGVGVVLADELSPDGHTTNTTLPTAIVTSAATVARSGLLVPPPEVPPWLGGGPDAGSPGPPGPIGPPIGAICAPWPIGGAPMGEPGSIRVWSKPPPKPM